MTETDTLTQDHQALSDTMVTRRYFSKFARITGHLARVAGQMEAEGRMGRDEVEVLARYLVGLGFTFRALANKHFWSGRGEGHGTLTFDRHESGFPVHAELLQMAADAAQADKHLAGMPSAAELKSQMVQTIVGEFVGFGSQVADAEGRRQGGNVHQKPVFAPDHVLYSLCCFYVIRCWEAGPVLCPAGGWRFCPSPF